MYDIVFLELTLGYEYYLPLAEKFGIPVIGTISFRPSVHSDDVFGDSHPLAVPSMFLPLPRKMGFFQRLWNVFDNLHTSLLIKYFLEPSLANFYEEYFPDFNVQFNRNISLLFCNNHVSLFSTPLTPKVVEVAGIHLVPVKPLPEVSNIMELHKASCLLPLLF